MSGDDGHTINIGVPASIGEPFGARLMRESIEANEASLVVAPHITPAALAAWRRLAELHHQRVDHAGALARALLTLLEAVTTPSREEPSG